MKRLLQIYSILFVAMCYSQTPIYKWDFDGNMLNSGSATISSWISIGTGSVAYVPNRLGQVNSAINIPNTQGYTIDILNGVMPSGNAARTLSFWVKFANDTDNKTYPVVGWGNGVPNQAFGFWRNGVQNSYYTWGSGNDYNIPQTNVQIQSVNNGWVHVAMTHTGSTLTIYYNGVNSGNYARTLNTGNQNFTLNRLVNGSLGTGDAIQLDDLRIYNTALNATQVADIYNQTSTAVPTVSNVSATNIGTTTATINYTVNANNAATNTEVRYAVSPGGTLVTLAGPNATGTTDTNFSVNLTGLTQNTTYEYNIRAVNSQGNTFSTALFFTTTAVGVPVISSVSVSNITSTTATVNFSLNSGGIAAPTTINYGTSATALTSTTQGPIVTSTNAALQSVNLNALIPNTTYFYQVTSVNTNGLASSSVNSFTTPATSGPAITNVSTSNVTFNSATVNFNLNAFGSATNYVVEYSTDIIGNYTPVTPGGTTAANTSTPFTVQISGLNSSTQYFVRVRATNAANQVTTSNEVSFTTLNSINLTNIGVSNVTATTAQINYTLNTNGTNAFIEIRYQSNTVFDSASPFTTEVISNFATVNNAPTNYNYSLTGLIPNTTYSYQFGAVNQINGGVETGENAAFTTLGVSVQPTAPSPQTFCQSSNPTVANLSATGTNIKWYANATGGSPLVNTTPLVSGTYYVTQTQTNSAESGRLAVTVTVNVTTAPTAQAQSFCNSATVANLTATGTNLKWYAAQTGGSQLANPTALATGNYFVSQTVNGCESARTVVAVTINIVGAPTASAQSFCNSATVANLVATGTGTIAWFNVATGGTALASTTALATGTYFVQRTIGSCTSTRTSVAVTVGSAAAPTASAQSFCNSATIANLTATGTNLKWYAAQTGGSQLANPTALATGNYFVSQTVNGCESPRTAVSVTVNVVTAPTGNATQTFVQGATISNLVATGSSIVWFASLANATANTNPLVGTTPLVNNTTYYAMQTVNGCRSSTPLAVTVTVTLSNIDVNKLVFSMYPNPAKDRVTIEMETELQSVEIYTLQGQIVQTSTNKNVFLNNLPTGVYIVKVEDVEGLSNTKKLIIK
jgi:hypothetical protein